MAKKYYEIRGYDSNFDLAGYHENPLLATVYGTYSQVEKYAKTFKSFEDGPLKGEIVEIEVLDLDNLEENKQ